MKTFRWTVPFGIIATVLTLATPGFSQESQESGNAELAFKTPVDEPSSPIPFMPIRLRDTAGRPLPPALNIPWKATGEIISVREAERRLNALEASANAVGESFTDRMDAVNNQEEADWQHRDAMNADMKGVLARSMRDDQAHPATSTSSRVINAPATNGKTRSAPATNGKTRSAAATRTAVRDYKWGYVKGDRDNAAISVQGIATFKASPQMAELNASLDAKGYLKGKELPICKIEYLSDAPAKGSGRTIVQVTVGGRRRWNEDRRGNFQEWQVHKTQWPLWNQDLSKVEIRTSIGPIPVVARAAIEGHAGISLKVSLRALGTGVAMVPFINTAAYAEAGVGVPGFEIGVGGELTLLRYEAPIWLYGEARISRGRWALRSTVDASNSIIAGSGRLYAYVEIDLGFWDKKKKKTLVSWDEMFALDKKRLFLEEYWQFI